MRLGRGGGGTAQAQCRRLARRGRDGNQFVITPLPISRPRAFAQRARLALQLTGTRKRPPPPLPDKPPPGEAPPADDPERNPGVAAVRQFLGGQGGWYIPPLPPAPAPSAVGALRAARAAGIQAMVRIGRSQLHDVPRLLDGGCGSVMLPHLGLPQYGAEEALRTLRYAPDGARPTCTGVPAVGSPLAYSSMPT